MVGFFFGLAELAEAVGDDDGEVADDEGEGVFDKRGDDDFDAGVGEDERGVHKYLVSDQTLRKVDWFVWSVSSSGWPSWRKP